MLWSSRTPPPDRGGWMRKVEMAAPKAAAKSGNIIGKFSVSDAGKTFLPAFAIFIRDLRKHVLWYRERMTFF